MAQTTREHRIARIKELVAEQNKMPPTKRHEATRLPSLTGEELICPVIRLSVDEVVLNHQSHRVRANLQDDPSWQELEKDPYSDAAQGLIERTVRARRSPEEFAQLKQSLATEGQTDPGVVTYDGVLINANTRLVALRELEEPEKRFINVAVLPDTVKQDQLALLELRLQMRKEFKVAYSLSNELLFIEELATTRKLPYAQIARELGIHPDNPKKGEAEITQRLQFLDLIRQIQRIPDEPLKLTFFDDVLSYQHLQELQRKYTGLLDTDPAGAQRYLESYLLSLTVGVSTIHNIRKVDAEFMSDYMLPQLEDDEYGDLAAKVARGNANGQAAAVPPGLATDDPEDDEDAVDVKGLIDLVTRRDKTIHVPGTRVELKQDDVRQILNVAISTALKQKKNIESAENKLDAPGDAIKAAARDVSKALDAYKAIAGDPDFDHRRRKSLEAAFNRLKRSLKGLERQLEKDKVVGA